MPRTSKASSTPARPAWLFDFGWRAGKIWVRKTDIHLKLDRRLIAEVGAWLVYFVILAAASLRTRFAGRRKAALWFTPDTPRPWYLIRGAALWAGISTSKTEAGADAAFYFDDVTVGEPGATRHAAHFNFGCRDISKSHVAKVFEAVSGYCLAVDPFVFDGPMVEKSEKNGVHDGRIVTRPTNPAAGRVYQRLVETCDDLGQAHDLRTLCAGGSPVLVWVKTKPAGRRFAIHNRAARLKTPDEVFTHSELALIGAFTARIGLDWGGLDILRDRIDGRIYIVDVNKTDVGPVIALSWSDKIRSMQRLAVALERLLASAGVRKADAATQQPNPSTTEVLSVF